MTGDRSADRTAAPEAAAPDASAVRAIVEARARTQARSLTMERLTRAFWPAWAVVALFLGAALSGAFDLAPPLVHAALLGLFALAGLAALARGAIQFRAPTGAEAMAALDRGADDRPVAALSDTQALGAADPAAQAIWALHQRRMAARALAAMPRPADLRLAKYDPYGLRLSALIALIVGGGIAALDGGDRLSSALNPGAMAAANAVQPSIEAWATPPAYTGAEMVYLTERPGETVDLPAGSRLSFRVYNASVDPVLIQEVADDVGAAPVFAAMGEGAYDLQFDAMRSGLLSIKAGGATLGEWTFAVTADLPPSIALVGEVGASETHALQFDFEASDDFGVASAWAVVELDVARLTGIPGPPPPGLEPIEIELPLPFTGAVTETTGTVVEDLIEHPWAGLPVTITLYAEDAGGRQGVSGPIAAVIPSRPFSDPMAKAVVEQRRTMATSMNELPPALQRLRAVTAYPEDWFAKTMRPYLVVRTAMRRLEYALADGREAQEIGSVMELLWQAALLLEDGDLASAAERLRRAKERLSDAIEQGASPEELARLTDELRQAMNEYIAEMARQAMQNLDQLQQQQQQGGEQSQSQRMQMQDLQQMLDEIQRLAESGDRESAQKMLQALQQMLENMQMQAQQGQGEGGEGQQAMDELQEMLRSQQDLADQSFEEMQRRQGQGQPGQQGQEGQQGQQGQQGGQGQPNPFGQPDSGGMGPNGLTPRPGDPQQGGPGGEPQDLSRMAQEQEALRQLLEDLRAQIPGGLSDEATEALRDADEAMGSARERLDGESPGEALDDQVRAMENLREGARQLGDAMRKQAQQGQGDQAGQGDQNARDRGRDPLGRPTAQDGAMEGADTQVPSAEDMMRARELLDEIRRRSGDRTRPELELDYLRRLLERF
ncbi:MAG: hypothetical protein ACI9ZH_001208 [Paracoccaceae bacterium]|jgi:uncharacterized protein (TIGR02302 family)